MGKIVPFYNDDAIVKQSLKTIIDDAIYKDVFKRYKIKSKDVFEKIFKYVFDNVGKEFSCKNVAEILHLNFRTIVNHLNWLENANIILPISYFEVKGKRILKTNKKYYASDLGVLSSVDGYDTNIGWKLENLVLLVLLSKYDNVYTYKNYNGKQVDFVCEKDKTLVYVQVTKFLIEKNEENSN
jgi:predicted AAA+ superfamily ATPase